jgi:two-component system, chemotaxis family, sensor kinase CheA
MTIDLSRFAKAFYEEAQDHLGSMESLLVAIDSGCTDAETLNALFRAVHSIKGGAAAFGHVALMDLTHDLETILDRVRKREFELTKTMVTTILTAGDLMRAHVKDLDRGTNPDLEAAAAMRGALAALCHGTANPAAPAGQSEAGNARFAITLDLDPHDFPDDASVASLVDNLSGLGRLSETQTTRATNGKQMLKFEVETDADEDELRDAIVFLMPEEAIQIRRAGVLENDPEEEFGFFPPMNVPAAMPSGNIARATSVDAPSGMSLFSDANSIRVSISKVDGLINLVGELVITEAMLSETARVLDIDMQGRLAAALAQLERNTRDLQESIMGIRMVPISFIFSRLPRLARDVADRLGKDVELEMIGEDTELDKGLIEKITDPVIHLVRNAIDHGIETASQRLTDGKSAKGKLTVRARHQGGMIVVSVADDGAGLDRDRILRKARELEIATNPNWTDQEVWRLIFRPGFSTSMEVTDVSGRGVGMDIVIRNVEALGGSVEIASERGAGTTLTIRLPLTLAILDGMSVSVSGETYILPLQNVEQSLQPREGQVNTVGGREVLELDHDYIPVIGLTDIFDRAANATGNRSILAILESEGRRVALRVDELLGQHQVVLKSLEQNYRKVDGISGATILGDGRVAFIMDVSHVVAKAHAAGRTRKMRDVETIPA